MQPRDQLLFRALLQSAKSELRAAARRGQIPRNARSLEEDVHNYGDFFEDEDHAFQSDAQRLRLWQPLVDTIDRWLENGGLRRKPRPRARPQTTRGRP